MKQIYLFIIELYSTQGIQIRK